MTWQPNIRIGLVQNSILSLVAPTLLASGSAGTVQTSITSGSFSPSANALIIAVIGARGDGAGDTTIDTPTNTFGSTGSWVVRQGTPTVGPVRYVNTGVCLIQADGSPGSGTITFEFSDTPWNQIYMIYEVTQGFNTTPSSYPWKAGAGTGTSLGITFDSGPSASSLGFYACTEEGSVAGGFTIPTGTTVLNNVAQSSNIEQKTAYKLLSPATTNTWTGLDNTAADVGVHVEVLQVT